MRDQVRVEVNGKELALSNLDKVMYPKTGFTKGQVIDYYGRIAEVMLPHLKGRPVTLKRYPDGVEGKFFYEKECPSFHPDWVDTATLPSEHGKKDHVDYCMVDNRATLLWLANLASLELHALLSLHADVSRPTCMVFDLDPGEPADILDCAWTAMRLREILNESGLRSTPKTSGKKGIHVCVPLNTAVDFDRTKSFAHAAAVLLARRYPERVTALMNKAERKGKVFVDWSQNDPHKSTVCVYSLRAVGKPHVSTPISWDELEEAYRHRQAGELFFETWEVLERVGEGGDLFEPLAETKQELPELEATDS